MQIPQQDSLSTNHLSRVFNNTVATYKYYWLISILNIYMSTGSVRISIWDIVISMVASAWYPIHYFRLSFGKSDSMYIAIRAIREITGLPFDASKTLIAETLKNQLHRKDIRSVLKVFTLNVPFRFLRPWIDTSDDKEVVHTHSGDILSYFFFSFFGNIILIFFKVLYINCFNLILNFFFLFIPAASIKIIFLIGSFSKPDNIIDILPPKECEIIIGLSIL